MKVEEREELCEAGNELRTSSRLFTAPGWVRDENGVLRRETIHRMGRRAKNWDYRGRPPEGEGVIEAAMKYMDSRMSVGRPR